MAKPPTSGLTRTARRYEQRRPPIKSFRRLPKAVIPSKARLSAAWGTATWDRMWDQAARRSAKSQAIPRSFWRSAVPCGATNRENEGGLAPPEGRSIGTPCHMASTAD